jgi:predicted N-acetyltransferase YhbS
MIQIDREAPGEGPAREALLDRCFGRARWFKTCQRLRRDRLPAEGLSFSAREDGALIGTVRLWHIEAGDGVPALLLGPIAVTPERQSQGIGSALMREALDAAKAQGHKAVLLVGDAPYYERFGFSEALVSKLAMPGPVDKARFLGLELVPGALSGAEGRVVATGTPIPAMARKLHRTKSRVAA